MSDFEPNHVATAEDYGAVDFSRAIKLKRSGGSCDCYKARLHRRTVFVKRLKADLLHHPRYVGAFDKEYDIGVGLSHRALPEYREFHDDYIVMDYIDGKTLAELIAGNDSWLRNDANIRKVVERLIDVVDYLHQCDVVHCDIKADNVMITNGNRNLKLIDLGNAYTDWFTDTSGNPANYELETDDTGNPEMDFRGIGDIVQSLSDGGFGKTEFMLRFRKLCYQPGVTAETLRDELTKSAGSSRSRLLRPAILIISLMTLCLCVVLLFKSRPSTDTSHPISKNDTIYVKPVAKSSTEGMPRQYSESASGNAIPVKSGAIEPQYEEIINSEMKAMVKNMSIELDKAEALINDSTATVALLRKTLAELADTYTSTAEQSYSVFKKRFPETGNVTIELAVTNSPAYQSVLQRYTKVSQRITDRIFEIQNK